MAKERDISDPRTLDEAGLDSDRMGRNSLQGDDQRHVRNEREALPDEREEADGIEESFEKLDKERRAGSGPRQRGAPDEADEDEPGSGSR